MVSTERKVLVVEDNRNLSDLYVTWLEGTHDVETAENGREALERIDETIDVVLLDRRMPGISGDEVLAEIRDRDIDCCVALVTSVEPDFDILGLGFDAYLEKPVSGDELHRLVDVLSDRLQYDELLQKYFALQAKRTTLEAQKDPRELEGRSEFEELVDRLSEIEQELQHVRNKFSVRDYHALFHRIPQPP